MMYCHSEHSRVKVSHVGPVKKLGQLQVKLVPLEVQVPPTKQGELSQGLVAVKKLMHGKFTLKTVRNI